MAKIIVENATVKRVFTSQHGWGVSVYETFKKRDESEGRNYFTLWFKDAPGVEEGQVVSASGFHSARVREYESNGETHQTADVSVNSARLIASPAPVAQEQMPVDPWEQSGSGF